MRIASCPDYDRHCPPLIMNATDRRYFIPEVIQTSDMDCGPAALKSLFEGFNIPISYGRLREACQTQVDGSSINTLEEIALKLGLDAEQTMLPPDHLPLLEAAALPAILVVTSASKFTHFVVLWRMHGPFAQVMDPSRGRRWVRWSEFVKEIFIHHFLISGQTWRAWAGENEFLGPLRHRMRQIGVDNQLQDDLVKQALADPTWRGLAALDAKVRMVTALIDADGLNKGAQASAMLQSFEPNNTHIIPSIYWCVSDKPLDQFNKVGDNTPDTPPVNPTNPADNTQAEQVFLHGAVLLRISGVREVLNDDNKSTLPPELKAALTEKPVKPLLTVWRMLREDQRRLVFIASAIAMFLSALGSTIEIILLQTISQIGNLALTWSPYIPPISTVFLTLIIAVLVYLIDLLLAVIKHQIGRHLEMRLRIRFLEKVPRLGDRYFHSRLISDMTSRAHGLLLFRYVNGQIIKLIELCFTLLFSLIGIYVLDPSNWLFLILFGLGFTAIMRLSGPFLIELERRVSTTSNALSRFYLDAMMGLTPLLTHGAERAFRREQEGLLTDWARLSLSNYKTQFRLNVITQLFYAFVMISITLNYISHHTQNENTLLLIYWVLNLPTLTQAAWKQIAELPDTYNALIRLLDPLNAPDEELAALPTSDQPTNSQPNPSMPDPTGVKIEFNHVEVQARGQVILQDVQLTIEQGEHIAIVGPSGAGKSSLVSLLLGWHRPVKGDVLVDGVVLDKAQLSLLRQYTAWVDPAIQLWNRTLIKNLTYGNHLKDTSFTELINQADLYDVLSRLPNGLQTVIGENGGLLSGGEGQRVRLARAMARKDARLVILDESLRGLDREKRRELLARARQYWANATLICITHDVGETLTFNRVVVIEHGRVIEDNHPKTLAAMPSRYQDLLNSEEEVRQTLWKNEAWQRVRLQNGSIVNNTSETS